MNQDGQFEFSNTPNPSQANSPIGSGFESRTGYNRAAENPNSGIIGSALTPAQTNAAFTSPISSLAAKDNAANPIAPVNNQPRMTPAPAQTNQYSSPTPALTYGDILAEANNRAASRRNLIPFLSNKLLIAIGGGVLIVVAILIVLAATRTTPASIADAASANSDLSSLSALLQYGQNNISEQNMNDSITESDLVLISVQNSLSAKFSGIAKSSDSSTLDDSTQTKFTNAQATSTLNGTFYDQMKLDLTNTSVALTKLAKDSKSADQQTLAANSASEFNELLKRLEVLARPTN